MKHAHNLSMSTSMSLVSQRTQSRQSRVYVASLSYKSEEADSLDFELNVVSLQSWSAISLMLLMLIATGDD